ncbi:MAG: 7-cyano-7-deazaguanine synthase [Gemmataceae bacterium]|nr:7-cyano-7-deazaguanine synthase [Gemmataceae bacterium]
MSTMALETLHDPRYPLAVLISGGLDSAVLLCEAAEHRPWVQPIYIRAGTWWEEAELRQLRRFLDAVRSPRIRPLVQLRVPVDDLYGEHWSLTGQRVPDQDTPDEAVYLPGRNLLLLGKALVWCHLNDIPELALAPLSANPFPDASPEFFDLMQETVNRAVSGRVRIIWPYLHLSKAEVIRRGSRYPLVHTLSCMRPGPGGTHCGRCNKCAERRRAFAEASVHDPTNYDA